MSNRQLTVDDYGALKQSLKQELSLVYESFVSIGYKLRVIQEQRLYEHDGYGNIAEFAKSEYGLSQSTVSKFININRKFSIGGFSDKLQDGYLEFGVSKLSEMLTMKDSDIEVLTPAVKREDIREMKTFFKEEKAADLEEETEDIPGMEEIVNSYFDKFPKTLDELIENQALENNEWFIKTVVPNGVKTYHTERLFVMMDEEIIRARRLGEKWKIYEWQDFMKETQLLAEIKLQNIRGEYFEEGDVNAECDKEPESIIESDTREVRTVKNDSSGAVTQEQSREEEKEENIRGEYFKEEQNEQKKVQESIWWDFELVGGDTYHNLYYPEWREPGEQDWEIATIYRDMYIDNAYHYEIKLMKGYAAKTDCFSANSLSDAKTYCEKIVVEELRNQYKKITKAMNDFFSKGGGLDSV